MDDIVHMDEEGPQSLFDFSNVVCFFINGKKVQLNDPDPEISLLHYLRRTKRLTGSKQSCNEGGCGSCTVMISKHNPILDKIRHFTVTACLVSICSLDGVAVTTVEGIGSTRTQLHPCQKAIAHCHGSQCGFCTPGMVMSMYTLLRNNRNPTEADMEKSLRGNLCRCTGYRPILDSFRGFCSDCTCNKPSNDGAEPSESDDKVNNDGSISCFVDPTQDTIFPAELKVQSSTATRLPVMVKGPQGTLWFKPVSLQQLLVLRNKYPHDERHKIVAGNTYLQHCKVKVDRYDVLISVDGVSELKSLEVTDDGLVIGAAITLTELEEKLSELVKTCTASGEKCKVFEMFLEMFEVFGSLQIRNQVTLGGAIMSGSIDILPMLVCSQSRININSINNTRELILSVQNTAPELEPNEVLTSVCIPYSQKDEWIISYKQSRRKYLDSSTVSSCMYVRMDERCHSVRDCRLVYGNILEGKPWLAHQTMKTITQYREWDEQLVQLVYKVLLNEIESTATIKQDSLTYRNSTCLGFFYKFFIYVSQRLSLPVNPRDISAVNPLPFGAAKGSQGFQSVASSQPIWDSIGRPVMHLSAEEQATGEAKYVDDLPNIDGELFAGFVLSTCAHGTFTLDTSPLETMQGIAGFVCAKDVPASNITGLANDEKLFAENEVTSIGQIIGLVLSEDKLIAQRGAMAVRVEYNELPLVLTIDEAIAKKQFFGPNRELKCGDAQTALEKAKHSCSGEMIMGGQEHYYMETCSCICIPHGEKNEMEIISSTQNLTSLQGLVSQALGIPNNRITAKVKRLGGGFGGKEMKCGMPYTAVAVAANKMQVPVRAVFERHEDMANTGGREPVKAQYKVGFSDDGKLEALDVSVYINAGYSMDLSVAVTQVLILQIQSAYNIPNIRVSVQACRTNLPSNTAMRGFGLPQALMIMENVLSHIADYLGIEKAIIQELNLLRDGDKLLYGYETENCTIRRCWRTLKDSCQYDTKKNEVIEFNRKNKWKKRGISLVPTQQGVAIPEILHYNHGSALVIVYTDGSVLLAHGGIEMGQGLHTKMVQVCSRCLSIPMERIHLKDTSTDKVANSFATSASLSSDLYGMAVKDACDQINERLKPIKEENPDGGWDEWIKVAYESRVNLSAQGFYKTPKIWMDWDKGIGEPFSYYTYGVGCSVVEIDVLTGQFKIVSADLLMDVGDSLNPAIDIGQVEGAFMQGLGLFTMEECVFSSDGKMLTVGPGEYKIPGVSDIPAELNVTLLDRCPNPKAIFSSKAIGEPPLFLAASVFYAIKEAIKSAREDHGVSGHFTLWSPATAERISLACKDCIKMTDLAAD